MTTESNIHFYEIAAGHGLRHDPFNAIIAPRPIGWISSRGEDGRVNLAPYSFFNGFNYVPPIIGFSSIGWKDTVRNISETGEFCWNLAGRALADAMNLTCAPTPPEISEFEVAGLTPAPSRLIDAPRVLESPVNFECRLTQLIQLQTHTGKSVDSWLILGEVIAVHIDRSLIIDGVFDTAAAQPIMRAGRMGDYFTVTAENRFEMVRPGWPLK